MAEEADVPYYCIRKARCRLCLFELKDNEVVLAGLGDHRVSSPFLFSRQGTIHDEFHNIKFHMCCSALCMFNDRNVPCYHCECFEFRLLEITPQFLLATEYDFQPPAVEDKRRRDRIKRLLSARLEHAFEPQSLPRELWEMIAVYLDRECAVISTELCIEEITGDQAIQANPSGCVLDPSLYTLARYFTLDGFQYIRSLRCSSTPEVQEGERVLLKPQRGGSGTKIHFAKDHFGMREMFSASSNDGLPTSHVPGKWWTSISIGDGDSKIFAKSDGIKIRSLELQLGDSVPNLPSWSICGPHLRMTDLKTLLKPRELPVDLRMHHLECNSSSTTGYTAIIDGMMIMMIHAHRVNEDDTFYLNMSANYHSAQIVYMPIDEGELLTDIWVRQDLYTHPGHTNVGLLFVTNRKRVTLFGHHLPDSTDYLLQHLHSLPERPSRIYFNTPELLQIERGIRYMAFEGDERTIQPQHPDPLITKSRCPWTQYNVPYFFSGCNLNDAVEFTLCRDVSSARKRITGMLVIDSQGHRSCLGEFRFD